MSVVCKILEDFTVSFEIIIVSVYTTAHKMSLYTREALEGDIKFIIVTSSGVAHLLAIFAVMTSLHVIGVMEKDSNLGGVDFLHFNVYMSRGVPMITTAIINSTNNTLLAVMTRMLGVFVNQYFYKMSQF